MALETTSQQINRVEAIDTGELLLVLASGSNPDYQFVYRAAAGVYWDEKRHGFKSIPMKEMSCPDRFSHIVNAVKSELGVSLEICDQTKWLNISEQDKIKIERGNAI